MKKKHNLSLVEVFVAVFIFSIFFAAITQIYRTNALHQFKSEKYFGRVERIDCVQKLFMQLVMECVKSGGQIYEDHGQLVITAKKKIDLDKCYNGHCIYRFYIDEETKKFTLKTSGVSSMDIHEQILFNDIDKLNICFYAYKKDVENTSKLEKVYLSKTKDTIPYAMQIQIEGKTSHIFTIFPPKKPKEVYL